MIDSWMPRKLEPAFDATYSKSSDLRTSSMKSLPGRPVGPASTSTTGSTSRTPTGGVVGPAPWAGAA